MTRAACRRARTAGLAAVVAALCGCAQPMPPPGGPPDTAVPKLLKTEPESGAVNVRPKSIVLTFDEVIAERGGGGGGSGGGANGMASFVVLSPVSGETMVGWSRDQLIVRPTKGFRPNAVYTLTLLPGISDLRNNTVKQGRTIVFATGPEIPDTRITGQAFDWVKAQPIAKGFVEAVRVADSTVYVGVTDSIGRFSLEHVPPGDYRVVAVLDANGNRKRDGREAYDSAAVRLTDSARVELLAFVHDTLGPRVSQLALKDSVTLQLTFDQPLLPSLALTPALFSMVGADSSSIPVARVLTVPVADSLAKAEAAQRADSLARADTSAAARAKRDSAAKAPTPAKAPGAGLPATAVLDTARTPARGGLKADSVKAAPPKPSKPSPLSDLVLKLERPLSPATRYGLRLSGVQGLLGASRASERFFVTAAKRDTTAAKDSTRRAPTRPPRRPPA
jgi:hypothetical protein